MEIKKIQTENSQENNRGHRPETFDDFIGQEQIKGLIKTAIKSGKLRQGNMGHFLFS
ncbi:MAG: hypothetical protein WCJ39_04935 [bacterium]